MLPSLLVTGATGFVGNHVREACGNQSLPWSFTPFPKGADLRDEAEVRRAIADIKPDAVLHLAAQSFVPKSFESPAETFEINVLGSLNLMTALSEIGFVGPLVYASSGDVYGSVPEESLPVDETLSPHPRNPYSVSKVSAELLCMQRHYTEGLRAVIARPFNHVGPGQDERFVLPSIARQLALSRRKGRKIAELHVGDIDVTRDFTDVRDVVQAYGHLLLRGVPGQIYNICSGQERSIRQLISELGEIAGLGIEIIQDPAKMRRAEQQRMVANARKIQRDTGWTPTIPIHQTLENIFREVDENVQ